MELSGQWENQNGSILSIDEVSEGTFTGTFVSAKGRAARDRRYAVRGTVNGQLVAFAVNFANEGGPSATEQEDANLQSISNFTGRLQGDVLHTIWVLARAFEDAEHTKPTQPWNTFLVNADRFVRIG